MESMKKIICAALAPLLCLYILFPARQTPAAAEEAEYACIRSDDIYLYAEENDRSGLFILPYTYYVKVLAPGIEYCRVEYLSDGPNTRKVTGYCKTADLTFVDYVPERPYLYYTFDVTYTIEGGAPSLSSDGFLTEITVTCAYYGEYRVGSKIYCYVLREGEFGYIPRPDDLNFDLNGEYEEHLSSAEPDTGAGNFTDGNGERMSTVQIVFIVLLCILVPVAAALILRPPKKPPYEPDD